MIRFILNVFLFFSFTIILYSKGYNAMDYCCNFDEDTCSWPASPGWSWSGQTPPDTSMADNYTDNGTPNEYLQDATLEGTETTVVLTTATFLINVSDIITIKFYRNTAATNLTMEMQQNSGTTLPLITADAIGWNDMSYTCADGTCCAIGKSPCTAHFLICGTITLSTDLVAIDDFVINQCPALTTTDTTTTATSPTTTDATTSATTPTTTDTTTSATTPTTTDTTTSATTPTTTDTTTSATTPTTTDTTTSATTPTTTSATTPTTTATTPTTTDTTTSATTPTTTDTTTSGTTLTTSATMPSTTASTATTTGIITTTADIVFSTQPPTKLSAGAVTGIVLGSVCALGICILLLIVLMRRSSRKKQQKKQFSAEREADIETIYSARNIKRKFSPESEEDIVANYSARNVK